MKNSYEIDWTPEQTKTNKQAGQSISSTSGFMQMGAMQGWQCPVCKRVLSPWTQECPCRGKIDCETTVVDGLGTTLTISEEAAKHIPHLDTYYTETGTK